jgi:hypothetical protein
MRKPKLVLISAPPRAEIWISRASRVKTLPRAASLAPFLRLMVDHFECPDMTRFSFLLRLPRVPVPKQRVRRQSMWFGEHRALCARCDGSIQGRPDQEKPAWAGGGHAYYGTTPAAGQPFVRFGLACRRSGPPRWGQEATAGSEAGWAAGALVWRPCCRAVRAALTSPTKSGWG